MLFNRRLQLSRVRTPGQGGLPPPLLGQHTEEVLRGVLHYSDAQLSELKTAQVI